MYTDKIQAIMVGGTLGEVDLSSVANVGPYWIVLSPITISRLCSMVSTILSSTGNALVTFWDRPTFGSDSGRVSIGTLKIGTASGVGAVGLVNYTNITPYKVTPGRQIITAVTTAVTTSGKAIMSFEASEASDDPRNDGMVVGGA